MLHTNRFLSATIALLDKVPNLRGEGGQKPLYALREPSIVTINQILLFLRRHQETLGVCIVAPVLLAILYCAMAQPIYTARAQLLLDPQTPQPLQEQTGNSNSTYDNPQIESQIALLRSDTIASTVSNALGLLTDPEFGGDPVPPAEGIARQLMSQRLVSSLTDALDVRRSGLSYAIEISFSSRDPDKAAKIANGIAGAFIEDQLDARARAVRAGSEWLEDRIDGLRKQMNESALKVQQFKVKRDYRIVGDVSSDVERPAKPEKADKSGQSADSLSLEELESTASTYRRIYESYLQAYTESLQRQSFPISNARVITPASRPLKKSSPKTLLIIAFATLVGSLVGFGIAFLRDQARWKSEPAA